MGKKCFSILAVVFSSLFLLVGCAQQNIITNPTDNSRVKIIASVSESASDSVGDAVVGTTLFFLIKTTQGFRDSTVSATWKFKDGSEVVFRTCDKGLCTEAYKFTKVGVQTAEVIIYSKDDRTYGDEISLNIHEDYELIKGDVDSLFKWIKSEPVSGKNNKYNIRLGLGVKAYEKIAAANDVAVRMGRKGPRDDWNVVDPIGIASKTADGKMWFFDLLDVDGGNNYNIKIWYNIDSGRFVGKKEIFGNQFFDPVNDIFAFAVKYNGQVVPKTFDFGTPDTPIDTGKIVTTVNGLPGTNGDVSAPSKPWVLRWSYNASNDSLLMYVHIDLVASKGERAWLATSTGEKTLDCIYNDTVAVWRTTASQIPETGLRLTKFGRGISERDFSGSIYATGSSNEVIFKIAYFKP